MEKETGKVIGWTIDMHVAIDQQGKVKITQDLLDAFNIRPGDMLSFHVDTTKDVVMVTGSRKPPDFHPEIQVQVTPTTSDTPTKLSPVPTEQVITQQPVMTNPQTSIPQSGEVTQATLFDTGLPTPKPKSRTQRKP